MSDSSRAVLVGKQVAQTITTQQNIGVLLIDGEEFNIRRLTPRECLRLQDFPDSFKIVTSDTQAYMQTGNSMAVGVIEMLFARIELALSCI